MIAIARYSFLCNSVVHFIPSIHFFSTWRIKTPIPSPEIYDVLVNKHNFSPDFASSLAASRSPNSRSIKRADSVLSYLKENSFTTSQLERIVIYDPRILGFTTEMLKLRLEVFQDLGLSSEEIAKIFSSHQRIFHSSVANSITPSLSVLKGLLRSNDDVARLLKRCPWFASTDLEKKLMPNVEILKSYGMPMERILHSLLIHPRCFIVKPDILRISVDKAIKIGVPLTSAQFIQAAHVFAFTSEEMWEVKLQTFHDLGFSDDDIFAIFRKQPLVLSASRKKMKNVIELLLATEKYSISSIVNNPSTLGYSIEKRLKPRLQILGALECRNLIGKWPALSTLSQLNDDKFVDGFVRPYYDEIGEECIPKIFMLRAERDEAL